VPFESRDARDGQRCADTPAMHCDRVGRVDRVGSDRSLFFSSRRRHTRSVSAFLLNRSSDLKLAPSVCRMTFPILASLLVRLVVLLPFQLLRLSLATPSRWTPLALSVFLHCVVALLLTLL